MLRFYRDKIIATPLIYEAVFTFSLASHPFLMRVMTIYCVAQLQPSRVSSKLDVTINYMKTLKIFKPLIYVFSDLDVFQIDVGLDTLKI